MALITPFRGEGAADSVLAAAEVHFEEALEALTLLKRTLKDRDDITPADIQRIVSDYRKATQTLFDERKRLEDKRKKDTGVVHDYAVDLDAARDTVGRLLDRLRTERGAGEISG